MCHRRSSSIIYYLLSVICYLLSIILLILSLALALLPFLPAEVAGYLIFISLAAVPIFIINLIVLAFSFIRFSGMKRYPVSRVRSRSRSRAYSRSRLRFIIPLLSTLLLLPCMSNYLPLKYSLHTVPAPVSVNVLEDSSVASRRAPVESSFSFPLTLTLISFNADNFQLSLKTLHEFADLVQEQDADIICLQERPHDNLLRWDSIRAAFPNYPYAIRNSREDEVLNLAVLSRYPLLGITERYYPSSYNKQLYTDIFVGADTLRLFNVHLQTTGLGDNRDNPKHALSQFFDQAILRNQQADDLISDVQSSPYPAIVCGDFNDTRAGYAYRRLRTYLIDANPAIAFSGSYQRLHNLYKIDHILCSSTFSPSNYQLISNMWSDHKVQIGHISLR